MRESQLLMARYLRDPQGQPAPEGVEPRRLKIYQDLVYNNIEGFICGGFPVLRSLYNDEDWHDLVRRFIDKHRCHTPYFLEISQEFLRFLMEDFEPRACDPPFLTELAHYEWVELALDVAELEVPVDEGDSETLQAILQLSPLAWLLSYRFPVHLIGPRFTPESAEQPCYLVVYRNRADKVCFLALSAATARLLELVRDNRDQPTVELLAGLAQEMSMQPGALIEVALPELNRLRELAVIHGKRD